MQLITMPLMLAVRASTAFHLPFQLISPDSLVCEKRLFVQAVHHVVEGFVPIQRYLHVATSQEPIWRRHRSERALEEKASMLVTCSLNPIAVAGKSVTTLQNLRDASMLFFGNEALAVTTQVNVVGDSLAVSRRARQVSKEMAQPAPPRLWEQLSLCQDAIACLLDVMRQRMGAASEVQREPAVVPRMQASRGDLLTLGRLLNQQNSPLHALLSLLEVHPTYSLGKAAAELGCSTRTLQRQLHPLGLSYPRVRLANSLLRSVHHMAKGKGLSEVAAEADFYDYPHFARVFKRSTGLSPLIYRQVLNHICLDTLTSQLTSASGGGSTTHR